jgi:hypothetical protein
MLNLYVIALDVILSQCDIQIDIDISRPDYGGCSDNVCASNKIS